MRTALLATYLLLLAASQAFAQDPGARWRAHWIGPAAGPTLEYGVYHFRRSLTLDAVPDSLPVYVSADNRYKLYVNGQLAGLGPARGDLAHWRYRRIDLRPYLRPGRNHLAALVWNFGARKPAAQHSLSTAFLLQAGGGFGQLLDTDHRWEVHYDRAYAPESDPAFRRMTYAVVGPGDRVDAARYPWGWATRADFSGWRPATEGPLAVARGYGTDGGRLLVPRGIPDQRGRVTGWGTVRRDGSPRVLDTVRVAAGARRYLVIDRGGIATGYPSFVASGGTGARVRLTYAEAAVDDDGRKTHRDWLRTPGGDPLGFVGHRDVFLADGGRERRFEPLWWRTARYVALEITGGQDELLLTDFEWRHTGYPLSLNAQFSSGELLPDSIWRVAWRTARLCAHETYVDCPYYEQLQYAGDTRIQSLITLYADGDSRLPRRALQDFHQSILPEGLTQSRYPSSRTQVIPPYSLFWVAMVRDYQLLRDEEPLLRGFLPAVRQVLAWHAARLNERGLLAKTRWWNFVDWTPEWPWDEALREGGVPPQTPAGDNATLSLQYAYVLRLASELFADLGLGEEARAYAAQRERVVDAVLAHCYDDSVGIVRELPGTAITSQHAQAMFALSADGNQLQRASKLVERIGRNPGFPGDIEATLYYRFYLTEAYARLGLGGKYLLTLGPWADMLALGLTTFAEKPEPTRSDTHAWSASPGYHFLSLVAGVRPAAPGFAAVEIAPALGHLRELRVRVPHPRGTISVDLTRGPAGDSLRGTVRVPPGLPGEFVYGASRLALPADGQLAVQLP